MRKRSVTSTRKRRREATAARPLSPRQLAQRSMELHALWRAELPDVDPSDLLLIIQSLLRPPGTGRRYFLRRRPGGGYVF